MQHSETKGNVWHVRKPNVSSSVVQRTFLPSYFYSIVIDGAKGRCVVATGLIASGSWICEYIGEVYYYNNFHRPKKYSFRMLDDYVVDAAQVYNISRYFNHSCNANCVVEELVWDQEPHLVIIANRDIDYPEELTIHYGFDHSNPNNFDDSLVCLCGEDNCIDKI